MESIRTEMKRLMGSKREADRVIELLRSRIVTLETNAKTEETLKSEAGEIHAAELSQLRSELHGVRVESKRVTVECTQVELHNLSSLLSIILQPCCFASLLLGFSQNDTSLTQSNPAIHFHSMS